MNSRQSPLLVLIVPLLLLWMLLMGVEEVALLQFLLALLDLAAKKHMLQKRRLPDTWF